MSELTCHSATHYACDCMRGLLADTEADLQEVRAELDAARTGHRAAVRALSQALGERDRLADGIRDINMMLRNSRYAEARQHSRSLLGVAGDDPPVPYRALEGSEGGEDGT